MADEVKFPNVRLIDVLLRDPLAENTRRERTRLLLSSVGALVVAKAGIIPTKIESLGVTFTASNQRAIVVLFGVVVAYFLLAFLIYGLFDIMLAIEMGGRANLSEKAAMKKYPDVPYYGGVVRSMKLMFLLRALLFELGLPVAVGVYAIFALIVVR